MNRSIACHKRAKTLAHATLALGLWIAPALGALGAEYQRPCPPTYRCPPGYYYNQGGMPSNQGAMPQAPRIGADGQPTPSDTSPSDQPGAQNQADAQTQTPQADQQQMANDFNAAQASSSRASLSPGADTPQLGRLDASNRLNLFDNMTAAPQSKLWFGYQYTSGIQTGLAVNPAFQSFLSSNPSIDPTSFVRSQQGVDINSILNSQRQNVYRVGAEVALYDDFSIAVQGQYYQNLGDDTGFSDDWSQPQILLKYMLARDADTIVSATLGILPETSVDQGDFEDNTTRLYPGMLFYETLSPEVFTQGGFQFGIPTRDDQIYTFDWSLSLGFWLYQDANYNSCCDCCCSQSWIQGIIPQIGLLGKHVIGDNTRFGAFGLQESSLVFNSGIGGPGGGSSTLLNGGFLVLNEPTDVVDLTVGTLILVDQNVQVGLGYSVPVSDNRVRKDEFISYINYLF
jgi:hypothetical protein